jgi:glycosyltransferase involved in cell wall biosynthesis
MRLLLVAHNFLPAHAAGTEVYTGQLARALHARGHDVHLLTTEKDVARPDGSVLRRQWEGLEVTELTNNLFHSSFEETWANPRMEALFAAELERLKPDLVHFHHLLYLSLGCVERAVAAGLPVFFTLHDFWLQCARFGQRLHPDGQICERIDFARCGSCLATFKFRQSRLEQVTGRALALLRSGTGIDLSAAAKRAAARMRGNGDGAPAGPDERLVTQMAGLAAERDRAMRARVLPGVVRFLAPSRFLRERFLEWGIAPEHIVHVPTGLDRERFPANLRQRRAGESTPLRVAFLGTYARHKAPHLVLEAWARLPAALRERARLELRGPLTQDAEYIARLHTLAAQCGAQVLPALERKDVPAYVANLDLLIVPSVWYENSPMVIHEALSLETPLLVSNLGGMAELVEVGRSGEHFAVGDDADLAAKLAEFLAQPAKLSALYRGGLGLPSMDDHAREVERIYAAGRAKGARA